MNGKTDIWVYAHWLGMPEPQLIGVLSAQQAKGRKAFNFTYEKAWIRSKAQMLLDPDIQWYSGAQYPLGKENFGVFLDSMPDTWGRTLMKRRAAAKAKEEKIVAKTLYDIDYLLGVYDESRMGALRFKLDPDGPFLDNDLHFPVPAWSELRTLQHGAELIESDNEEEVNKGLALLLAPGSSLGGARPKANILDETGHPWIAKFPSKNDTVDQAAWEFLAYRLAQMAGVDMSEAQLLSISGRFRTFLTKRFDRQNGERIHFASAMTMTGNSEETIKDQPASYLDLAEFIQTHGSNISADLHQLWRRIVFNLMVSNTDDHLRNHGFLLDDKGWRLAPAYDINPSIDKDHLALNIDTDSNSLDLELARSVGEYFDLNKEGIDTIIDEVRSVCAQWQQVAKELKISRNELELMAPAFNLAEVYS
jgi:serine/threonine-protein kinase HipA